jgi:hypothetical protein
MHQSSDVTTPLRQRRLYMGVIAEAASESNSKTVSGARTPTGCGNHGAVGEGTVLGGARA